jgi:hypothetical protein
MAQRDDELERGIGIGLGVLVPPAVAGLLVPFRSDFSNATMVLAIVVVVVLVAAIGGRVAGVVAAISGALAFDLFHTRPYLSLSIASQDDVETTILLLVVGVVVGSLASSARRARRTAQQGRDELRRLSHVAGLVAGGERVAAVVEAAEAELTGLLQLKDCRFDRAALDDILPRLDRTGLIEGEHHFRFRSGAFELPDVLQLEVLAHAVEVGRFVMWSTPDTGAPLEARVVAVAIADQVGASIAMAGRRGAAGGDDVGRRGAAGGDDVGRRGAAGGDEPGTPSEGSG